MILLCHLLDRVMHRVRQAVWPPSAIWDLFVKPYEYKCIFLFLKVFVFSFFFFSVEFGLARGILTIVVWTELLNFMSHFPSSVCHLCLLLSGGVGSKAFGGAPGRGKAIRGENKVGIKKRQRKRKEASSLVPLFPMPSCVCSVIKNI